MLIMKKISTLILVLMGLFTTQAHAQLPAGSIAPDFTTTDLNGNEVNLYSLLDQGYTVILDFSATWCGPCWNYHNAHVLRDIWNQYGPSGTNEFYVLYIEADAATTLADLNGTGNNTQGNWVAGTPYPIIDDAELNDLYNIGYFPTIYTVCPNRIVTETGQASVAEHYAFEGTCLSPAGANNVGILVYNGYEGAFCGDFDYVPSIQFQNLGTGEVTSASFELVVNGESVETLDWTGSLNTFQFATIAFGNVAISQNSAIEINVVSVNGGADDDATANTYALSLTEAVATDDALLTLKVRTDNYAAETYWELLDETGNALYTGGNAGIFSTPAVIAEGAYTNATSYEVQLPVPANGCYEVKFYDFAGDGICCEYGEGSFSLEDSAGNVLVSGGEFADEDVQPFEVSGATPIANNAQIALYSGDSGLFCGDLDYAPALFVQNLGAAAITTMTVEVSLNGAATEQTWNGNIPSGQYATVQLENVAIETTTDVVITILTVNGEADVYDFNNSYATTLERYTATEYENVTVSVTTDQYGYETYWQIMDADGDVVASGGNALVGADGGGARVAAAGNPNVYGNEQTYNQEVALPTNGCYTLLVVDDYGDGMCCQYGDGSIRVLDAGGNVLVEPITTFTTEAQGGFERDFMVGTTTLEQVQQIKLFPNPASEMLNVLFDLSESTLMDVTITNALGQVVKTIPATQYGAGMNTLTVDVTAMPAGIYNVQLRSNNAQLTHKFMVK